MPIKKLCAEYKPSKIIPITLKACKISWYAASLTLPFGLADILLSKYLNSADSIPFIQQ